MSKCEFIIPGAGRPNFSPIQALKGLAACACLPAGRERCLESANCSTCDIAVCSIRTMKLPAHRSEALDSPKEEALCWGYQD